MNIARLLVLLFVLALPSAASNAAGQPALEPALEALRTALNDHDFDAVSTYLDHDFAFAGHGGEMGLTIMRQVVAGYPRTIESFEMTEQSTAGGQLTARVLFRLDGGEVESHELLFSEQGLLLKADVVRIQMAAHPGTPGRASPGSGEPTVSGESIPDRMIVPFELYDRLIVVEAEVEGVRGRFMVDTGATAALTLNSSRFPELAARGKAAQQAPHGANGEIHGAVTAEASGFRWRQLELENVTVALWDLDHLAAATEIDDLVGLIGYGLLERFLIELDYDGRRLSLSRLDSDGKAVGQLVAADRTIPAEMMFHMPVIEVELGGRTLRLGIDSGAEQAMLQTRWVEALGGSYTELGLSQMSGASENRQTGMEVRFDDLIFGGLSYGAMPFRFNDLQFPHEVKIDGLLGYDFLSRFRTAINLRKGEVLIWES